jgi:hypothetical protein
MHLALVGFTGSYNDQRWLERARAWAAEHDSTFAWEPATRHVFDLRGEQGRDFLADDGEYDVVILFAIYNPPTDDEAARKWRGSKCGPESLGVNHSRESWGRRLSHTRARWIFVFRRPDSVTGDWLGELDGYDKLPDSPGEFGVTIYRRNPSATAAPE